MKISNCLTTNLYLVIWSHQINIKTYKTRVNSGMKQTIKKTCFTRKPCINDSTNKKFMSFAVKTRVNTEIFLAWIWIQQLQLHLTYWNSIQNKETKIIYCSCTKIFSRYLWVLRFLNQGWAKFSSAKKSNFTENCVGHRQCSEFQRLFKT